MAAVKFIRSVQDWAYKSFGSERAVSLVAMATPEDMRVDAEHIKMADQFVEVPGGSNNNNYANVRLIVQTAEKANVDAVWPGWSVLFLSTVTPATGKRQEGSQLVARNMCTQTPELIRADDTLHHVLLLPHHEFLLRLHNLEA